MATNKLNGTDFLVSIALSGGTSKVIAGSKSCSISLNRAVVDATCKDDSGWAASMKGIKSWTVSTEGLYTISGNTVGQGTPDLFYFLINDATDFNENLVLTWTGDPDWNYYGYAILTDLTVNAGDQDVTTYSANFTGTDRISISGVTS